MCLKHVRGPGHLEGLRQCDWWNGSRCPINNFPSFKSFSSVPCPVSFREAKSHGCDGPTDTVSRPPRFASVARSSQSLN